GPRARRDERDARSAPARARAAGVSGRARRHLPESGSALRAGIRRAASDADEAHGEDRRRAAPDEHLARRVTAGRAERETLPRPAGRPGRGGTLDLAPDAQQISAPELRDRIARIASRLELG